MTRSRRVFGHLSTFHSNLPKPFKWSINGILALFTLFLYVPFALLMSQTSFIATLDVAVNVTMALQHSYAQAGKHFFIVSLSLIGASVLRYSVLLIVQPTTYSRSIAQSQVISASLCMLSALHFCMFLLCKSHFSDASPYPFSLFLLPFILSLLVNLSVLWVPTSHELAYAAETDLLIETGLSQHVVRGKAASVRYFLLDHPIHPSDDHQHYEDDTKQAHQQSITQSSKRPALVCLHGYGAAGLFYAHSMSRWSQTADVYSLDLVGFGLSSHDPFEAKTPAEAELHFVESIERWRIALNLDRMILLGHSFGGLVAAAYALKYPERVQGVLLASPVGLPDPPRDLTRLGPARLKYFRPLIVWLWQLGLTPASGLHFMGPLGPSLMEFIITKRFGSLEHVSSRPSFSRYMYHINAHRGSGLATLNSLIAPGAYARYPLGERMKQSMQVPTYFIFGQYDWMYNEVTTSVVQAMKSRGVVANLERVSNSGHQVSFENTCEFEQVVNKRMKEILQSAK